MANRQSWRKVTSSRRRFLGGAFAGAAGIAGVGLVGCGNDDDDDVSPTATPSGNGETPAPNGTPDDSETRHGGIWRSAGPGPIGIQDPNFGNPGSFVVAYMGDPFLEIDAESREVSAHIIEEWEQVDELTLMLHVRPGVQFFDMPPADGREMEAQDIVYTIRSMTGAEYPDAAHPFPRRSQYTGMRDVVAVDSSTVRLDFDSPRSDILLNLAEKRNAVIPEGLREHFGGSDSLHGLHAERLVGTGPFLPETIDPEREISFTRNPNYWNQPYPYIDGFSWVSIPDATQWANAMIAGENFLLNPAQEQTVDLVRRGLPDVQVTNYDPEGFLYHIGLNTRLDPLGDPRVRKAIAIMFDKAAFGRTLFGDSYRYPGPLPFIYPEAISQDELSETVGMRSPTDDDIAEARAMWEASEAGEFTLSITAAVEQLSTHQYQRVSEHLKSQVESNLPGMRVDIDATDYTGMLAKVGQGGTDYGAYTGGWSYELSPISMLSVPYHSQGGRNFTGWANSDMDALIDGAYAEFDEEARTGMLQDAQRIVLEEWSHILTHAGRFTALVHPRVQGLQLGSSAAASGYIRYAWLSDA